MGRRKVSKGASRGSEEFGRWLANTAYSIDQVAEALSIRPVSVYALRNGYWKPGLELAHEIERLTSDEVPVKLWTLPALIQRQMSSHRKRRKRLTRRKQTE